MLASQAGIVEAVGVVINELWLVPPFAIGSIPDTCDVKESCPLNLEATGVSPYQTSVSPSVVTYIGVLLLVP